LEAGTDTGGTSAYPPAFIDPLAALARVCTYDRLGTGRSDPAPDRRRTIDDLCDIQHEVRQALQLSQRTALVGQSGGGNIVIWCASRNPEEVAALVSIEGYHDDPKDLAAEGMRWDDNPEHTDWVRSAQLLDATDMPIGSFPVVVISATHADPGAAENQKYWLSLSKNSRQVVLDGGHNLHQEVPDKVVAEIVQALHGS
jgi:pimeloyl-ACP methyl ester carboxylesterase